jgi:hypothetical protein
MKKTFQTFEQRQFHRYETDNKEVARAIFAVAKRRGYYPAFGRNKDNTRFCIQIWGTSDELHRAVMGGYDEKARRDAKAMLEAAGQGHLCGARDHLKGHIR